MRTELRDAVRAAYSAAAEAPAEEHPFPVGLAFARSVGYPPETLERMSEGAADAFAGVSNVSVRAEIPPGATVVDIGCGAGLDTLIAAGRADRAVGIDFSDSMLARARQGAQRLGLDNVVFMQGAAESLPLEDASADVALVNGIFNLNRDRGAIFAELARVLRPGGSVYAAELVLRDDAPPPASCDPNAWFS